ncbi:MAG: hypothetical protein H6667_05125 [Ardenticatenaceae bacterium]|nr:hypothetical protein [Ardenticatenaceae bacterium]
MKLVGEIVRLQIQIDGLKRGKRPYQTYSTDNIQVVSAMRLTAKGVVGLRNGVEQMDVHHVEHPNSGYRDGFGISLGFTAHYGRMRDRFGGHITEGCAGENVIVATAVPLTLDELAAGLVIVTADGQTIGLERPSIMLPCEPFSRFCLQADDRPPALAMKETLQFLDNGMRGFGVVLVEETAVIHPGDNLFLLD